MNQETHEPSRKKKFQLLIWLSAAKLIFILIVVAAGVWAIYALSHNDQAGKQSLSLGRTRAIGFAPTGHVLRVATTSGLFRYSGGHWQRLSKTALASSAPLMATRQGWLTVNTAQQKLWTYNDTGKQITRRSIHQLADGVWAVAYGTGAFSSLTRTSSGTQLRQWSSAGVEQKAVRLASFDGHVTQLARHPSDPMQFALATTKGLAVTSDGGRHFRFLFKGKRVTSLAYGFTKQPTLYVALFDSVKNETALYAVYLNKQTVVNNLDLATVESDHVILLASNPAYPNEVAVVTSHNDLYLTYNGGENWSVIAHKGQLLGKKN